MWAGVGVNTATQQCLIILRSYSLKYLGITNQPVVVNLIIF